MSKLIDIFTKTAKTFKLAGTKQKTSTNFQNINMQPIFERNLDSIREPKLRTSINTNYEALLEEFPEQKERISLITDDIIQKLELCSDYSIKEKVLDILYDNIDSFESLKKAEYLLDAVNMSEQKYSVIRQSTKITENDVIPEARKVNQLLRKKQGEKLNDFTRFSGIRDFIEKYTSEEDIGKILWEKYFLPYVKNLKGKEDGQSVINKLKDIEQKFGTKIFIDNKEPGTNHMLNFVRKEFDMQKTYSNGKAKFTPYLHVSEYDLSFIKDTSCTGYCFSDPFFGGQYIKMNGIMSMPLLRHETEHFGDVAQKKAHERASENIFNSFFNIEEKAVKKPVTVSSKFKHFIETSYPARILKLFKRNMAQRKIAREENQEMKKAGISWEYRRYSRNNEKERRAVFVQGNMEAYSDKIKQRMINDGVPEFMTRMPQHTKDYYYKVLRAKCRDDENAKNILNKLNDLLDGNLDIIRYFFDEKGIKYIEQELKHYKDGEKIGQYAFMTKFIIRQGIPKLTEKLVNKFKSVFVQ